MTPHLLYRAIRMIETAQPIHAPAVRRWLDLLYRHLALRPHWGDELDRQYLERLFAEKFTN